MKNFLKITIFITATIFMLLIGATKAFAQCSPPKPALTDLSCFQNNCLFGWNEIPTDFQNYLFAAPTYCPQTPATFQWVSSKDDRKLINSAKVVAGTNSVGLKFNAAGVRGWVAGGGIQDRTIFYIPDTPGYTTIPAGTKLELNIGNNTGTTGSYDSDSIDFNYFTTNPSGFTAGGNYSFSLPYVAVGHFTDGTWRCNFGKQVPINSSPDSWKNCDRIYRGINLYIEVEPPPPVTSVGALTCATDNPTSPEKKANKFKGFAVDATNQASPPTIALLEKDKDPIYITANKNNPTTYNNLKSSLSGMLQSTNYDFDVDIGDYGYHDGNTHTLTAVLVTSTWPWFTLPNNSLNPNPFVFGGLFGTTPIPCGQGTVDQWMYPWLQTKGGDVIANGQIVGQNIQNPPSVIYSGSRVESSSDKEAEYLVISAVGGGYPFCSNNRYIPTNVVSQLTDIPTSWYCNNGSGYSVLNNYDLNAGSGGDAVVAGANRAYSVINNPGTAECAATKNSNSLANISVPGACTSGISNGAVIYKLSGNTLDNITVSKGRATIIVNGDLTINQNIIYSPASGIIKPIDMPGLGIIASGNIYIAPGVTRVDAILYAAGKIDTCGNKSGNKISISSQDCFTSSLPADKTICGLNSSPNADGKCFLPLTVNGALIGKSGFRFGRPFWNTSNTPAELVQSTPSLWLYPPLGMDLGSFSGSSSDYSIDYSEYQPRVSE